MKSKTVDIPIYFGKLTIINTTNFEKINKKYHTKINKNLYDAVVFKSNKNNEYIVVLKKIDWSVIAHEVVHLVNNIFIDTGIQLDRINDEPQAYLTGWIFTEIIEFLKENNINI